MDVSDMVRTRQEMDQIRERLSFALQSAGLGIWDLDPVNNNVKWDSRCRELFGFAEDGIIGGETVLYDKGEDGARVTPKTGRALFFRHGQNRGSVLHAGARLGKGTSKYVARINIMYDL